MKAIATDLRTAALGSFILVLPLAILESASTTLTRENAPGLIFLFALLWLLPAMVILVLMPIAHSVRARKPLAANPVKLFLSVAVVLVLALTWGSLVADQMPCFLGVPNCD
jgi:quinol-cytochrome oxidoreductase complex cytochrome b subunit